MDEQIKVLIVDQDESFRQKIRKALENVDDITVVGEVGGGQITMDLKREMHPDVVLLDMDTSHTRDLETMAQIRELFPHTKLVVLHGAGQERLILQAFQVGALGHLVKEKTPPTEIVKAIRAVSRGEAVLSPGVAGDILDKIVRGRRDANQSPPLK